MVNGYRYSLNYTKTLTFKSLFNYFKIEKAEKGQSGFVPVPARWIIERSNAWMERCKILVKNYEKTLKNANTKIQLCFLRIALRSLSS